MFLYVVSPRRLQTNAHLGGTPPPFMPGNAGFLYAGGHKFPRLMRALLTILVAYMAAGWNGSHGHAPGFPKDGSWTVNHEGLRKAL